MQTYVQFTKRLSQLKKRAYNVELLVRKEHASLFSSFRD